MWMGRTSIGKLSLIANLSSDHAGHMIQRMKQWYWDESDPLILSTSPADMGLSTRTD